MNGPVEGARVAADEERGVYQLSVFIHVISAVIWVGGMLFLALVIAPATRHLPPGERAPLFSVIGRRFRVVGWICIGLLIVTGLFNVSARGIGWDDVASGQLAGSDFGRILGLKLLFVAAMLVLSTVHDFVLGPASASGWSDPAARQRAATLRRKASWFARANAVLALFVIALATALVRGVPW